ncbi:MAG: hypothetical protein EBW68_07830 [Actinobacteria bacterium]|nr:hypothetical protein [Actinomycetota bacterium]
MEDEQQLPGDEISADTSRLNQEIGREEGQGSWDQFETEPEEDPNTEIESGQEEHEVIVNDSKGEEEEEIEQKNTLQGEPNRVLSFKDFSNKN